MKSEKYYEDNGSHTWYASKPLSATTRVQPQMSMLY